MTALYLLTQEHRAAVAALADMDLPPEVLADTLSSLGGELETKALSVAHVIRGMEADAEAVGKWLKSTQARIEHLREYLSTNLAAAGIQRVEGPGLCLSWRKASAVVIDEPGLIPATYMRQPEPPPPAPDKKAIADAIKSGAEVPGAHVETRQHLQIR